jgi:hypothetical protein
VPPVEFPAQIREAGPHRYQLSLLCQYRHTAQGGYGKERIAMTHNGGTAQADEDDPDEVFGADLLTTPPVIE